MGTWQHNLIGISEYNLADKLLEVLPNPFRSEAYRMDYG